LDEIPKPVVVARLRAGADWHGNNHRRFRYTALNSSRTMGSLRRRGDNSRSEVQNVRKGSPAPNQRFGMLALQHGPLFPEGETFQKQASMRLKAAGETAPTIIRCGET